MNSFFFLKGIQQLDIQAMKIIICVARKYSNSNYLKKEINTDTCILPCRTNSSFFEQSQSNFEPQKWNTVRGALEVQNWMISLIYHLLKKMLVWDYSSRFWFQACAFPQILRGWVAWCAIIIISAHRTWLNFVHPSSVPALTYSGSPLPFKQKRLV